MVKPCQEKVDQSVVSTAFVGCNVSVVATGGLDGCIKRVGTTTGIGDDWTASEACRGDEVHPLNAKIIIEIHARRNMTSMVSSFKRALDQAGEHTD